MTMATLQSEVDEWIREYTSGYFEPLMMLARLTEELGELSRAISHKHGAKRPKPGEAEGDIAGESADLLFVLICLANSLDIDLDEALAGMMRKIRERDATRWK